MVRCCVVAGTGSIGMRHLRLIQAAGVAVMAFPVRADRRAALEAAGFQVVTSWQQARDRGATHAVVATETSRHLRDVRDAADAGCDILVEKPLAQDAAGARAAASAAEARGVGLWVGCCLRFERSLERFRERLPELGRVHSVRIECQSHLADWRPDRPYRDTYSARADEGGVLRDLIHEIDYATWLFGWPHAVQARLQNLGRLGIDAEETADLLWETDRSTTVSVRLDYLTRPARRRMTAAGERGNLEWDGVARTVSAAVNGRATSDAFPHEHVDDMYRRQDAAFLCALVGGFDDRLATAHDGIRALAVCDAARRASASRCQETVAIDG